jgi:hypothetical protein
MLETMVKEPVVEWEITMLKASIHNTKQHPVFGEWNTYVSIQDDAGGPYLEIDQETDEYGPQKIRIDYAQFLKVAEAAKMLMHQMYIEKLDLELKNG